MPRNQAYLARSGKMVDSIHNCLLCKRLLPANTRTLAHGERVRLNCICCGAFAITRTAEQRVDRLDEVARALVMHCVRRASDVLVTSSLVETWLSSRRLPGPADLLDNFLLQLADELPLPGSWVDVDFDHYQAAIGAANEDGFAWCVKATFSQGLVDGVLSEPLSGPPQLVRATLTMAGWARIDDLRKSKIASKNAFMAMQFGDPLTDRFFRDHLVPATKAAGFDLRILTDSQGAGLIDDQLRVAIRRARFLVVDLSKGNKGAYWEAGFAEGLGKPVIYLCRDEIFHGSDAALKPHFDTSHLVTIIWSESKLEEAAVRLAACIRATLPDEARME